MTILNIIAIAFVVIAYVIACFALTAHYDGEEPLWFSFFSFPIDVVCIILFFPFIIIEKIKINKQADEMLDK